MPEPRTCVNCGAPLKYGRCEYCGTFYRPDAVELHEIELMQSIQKSIRTINALDDERELEKKKSAEEWTEWGESQKRLLRTADFSVYVALILLTSGIFVLLHVLYGFL